MPILVEITAQCRGCRALHEFQVPLTTDPSKAFFSVSRALVVAHLQRAGWTSHLVTAEGEGIWIPEGTSTPDWLCPDCGRRAREAGGA